MRLKSILKMTPLALLALAVVFVGCSIGGTGTMRLSVTDAPITDAEDVDGVYVTFTDVQYNRNGEWEYMDGFGEPQTFNLLELTGGESALLGALTLPAGTYEQIRFMVDGRQTGGGAPSNEGSWISRDGNNTYDEGVDDPLFIPSAAQTGYKATAPEPFDVPANGVVDITADFDLRRAVVEIAAGDSYILKPVVRLVVENQAGSITGEIDYTGQNDLVVYAYESGDFVASEAADPDAEESRFPNAVTSFAAADDDEDGTLEYTLAFLAEGSYDLVVAEYDPGATDGDGYITGSGDAVDAEGVQVEAGEPTSRELTE